MQPAQLPEVLRFIGESLAGVGWIPWVLFTLLVLTWIVTVYRSLAPGWSGVSYGVYKLLVKFGPRFYREIRGNLVDITDVEMSPSLMEEYRKIALENV